MEGKFYQGEYEKLPEDSSIGDVVATDFFNLILICFHSYKSLPCFGSRQSLRPRFSALQNKHPLLRKQYERKKRSKRRRVGVYPFLFGGGIPKQIYDGFSRALVCF